MTESRHDFLIRRSDEMRQDMTPAEKKLRRLLPSEWRAQEPLLGNYIADFYHPVYRIVIEADGAVHDEAVQVARDTFRNHAMERDGILVLRFTNTQIIKQTAWVVQTIDRRVAVVCRSKGIPLPGERKTTTKKLSIDRQRYLKLRRTNGGKRSFHVIPEKDPIDDL